MSHPLPSYLRTYRKRSGLTQEEIAFLLDTQNGATLSRYERLSSTPSLETALALEAVFGVPARELFRGVFAEVETSVIQRARLLSEQLNAGQQSPAVRHKLSQLQRITARREGPPSGHP